MASGETRRRNPTWWAGVAGACLLALAALVLAQAPDVGCPMHGGTDNIRYSPLTQINKANVTQLKVAWTYDSKDAFPNSEMQSHPVVMDGTVYVTTPSMKVAANRYHCISRYALDPMLNALRMMALPALMVVAARISHITSLPKPVLIASIRRDKERSADIFSPRRYCLRPGAPALPI